MITITDAAANQIREAIKQANAEGMQLRIAISKDNQGGFNYGMGFDNPGEDDIAFNSNGIDLIVSESTAPMVKGMSIDFVELNPGEFNFIFSNPNDPQHKTAQ